jgi:hypothetical protein
MGGECSGQSYSGRQDRLDLDAGCYSIANCFFADLTTDAGGGAIHFKDSNSERKAEISQTTFLRCCSTGGGWQRGGAIFSEDEELEVRESCAVECKADDLGSFAELWETGSQNRLSCVSCVKCASEEGGIGTVNCAADTTLEVKAMNFTECIAAAEGSALSAGRGLQEPTTEVLFTSVYVTCVCCGIGSVFHSHRNLGDASSISFSNFYGNSASAGVLCVSNGIGLLVSNCIFRDSEGPDVVMAGTIITQCQISNCVFSGEFPSSSYAIDGGGNAASSLTLSHAISFVNTELCPTASPTASPFPSFTPSVTQSHTANSSKVFTFTTFFPWVPRPIPLHSLRRDRFIPLPHFSSEG